MSVTFKFGGIEYDQADMEIAQRAACVIVPLYGTGDHGEQEAAKAGKLWNDHPAVQGALRAIHEARHRIASASAPAGWRMVPVERLDQFAAAVADIPEVAKRLEAGQQFNAFDSGANEDDCDDEDCEMVIAIGPINRALWLGDTGGRANGQMIEAALKFAAEAMLTAAPQPPVVGDGQDRKFAFRDGQFVNRVSGEPIPHDEPVIIFRARDHHALPLLREYLSMATDPKHQRAIKDRMAEFGAYARAHPERMKEPGITGDIRLNEEPAILATQPADERMREALEPVIHWYQSDEHEPRPLPDIVADVVADLQSDRAAVLKQRDLLDKGQLRLLAERFCATPLPDSVCVDLVATTPTEGRTGTNLMTVAEAETVLAHVLAALKEPRDDR